MARRLEAIAGVEAAALGRDLMTARGDVAGRPASDLVEGDFKEFNLAGNRVGIAQIEVLDAAPLLARRPELLRELRRVRDEKAWFTNNGTFDRRVSRTISCRCQAPSGSRLLRAS